jgi:hypothetical protein
LARRAKIRFEHGEPTTAHQTGADRTDYDVSFGPSNLVMQPIDCLVVADELRGGSGVARRMPHNSTLPLVF